MCHHRELEYERLYENAAERNDLREWANGPEPEREFEPESESEVENGTTAEKAGKHERTPVAPSVTDD